MRFLRVGGLCVRAPIRRLGLCLLAGAMCFSVTPALALEEINTYILPSTPNFRDLAGISASNGGTGFVNPTSNGGAMRTGVIYRSDYLSLSNEDWQKISTLNIGRDIDLRTDSEIASNPDLVPAGAVHTQINIYGTPAPTPSPFWGTPAEAVAFMESGYRDFVRDPPTQRDGFYNVLMTIAHDDFPVLYHCSGGKDRTGWTSVLLQTIAGVSQDTIMQDYLATNSYTAALMASTKANLLLTYPTWDPATIDALLGVQASYLQAAFDQVAISYGSMDAYLKEGLGLTQADIYVLRAKMVYYASLPGQSGMVGNAAAGASLLNALQNTPLSGHYTAYNYYLQSAIEAGTLGGVETQVGGQVHADAASFLLRQPQWIETTSQPYTAPEKSERPYLWMVGLGGHFESNGGSGIESSRENSGGTLMGATYRLDDQISATFGYGYQWGSVGSAGGDATLNTYLAMASGRYAFSSLEAGPYVTAQAHAGYVDYESKRHLGGGLGAASGDSDGALVSSFVGIGDRIRVPSLTLTPQTGVRVTHLFLGGFQETGSDLALKVKSMNPMTSSGAARFEARMDPQSVGAWTFAPAVAVGYERAFNDPQSETTGSLYNLQVSQKSAFDSRNLANLDLDVTARYESLVVKAGLSGLIGDAAKSSGVNGRLSVSYNF